MTARGLHHVTAISGQARVNLAFHVETLGLRLLKRTVNFDDPGTWHLYFGDEAGQPGSIMTYFPWAHAAPGRLGTGETQETAFRVPQASIAWWLNRFVERGVDHDMPETVFGASTLKFRDPHGTRLALVGQPGVEAEPAWSNGTIPAEHAIRGFSGVTLLLDKAGPTARVLTEVLGFTEIAREGVVTRYAVPGQAIGGVVDLREVGGFPRGRTGAGTVHHIAFRAADDEDQAAMAAALTRMGIATTAQRDRNYFRSIYFREPGGLIFEIATDDPGFAVDEAPDRLGSELKLPGFLEGNRAAIARALPPLD